MFHLVDPRQFATVAFELNGDAHLLTWVCSTDAATPALHAASGIRGPDLLYREATTRRRGKRWGNCGKASARPRFLKGWTTKRRPKCFCAWAHSRAGLGA